MRTQGRARFAPGNPDAGYYNDLRGVALSAAGPGEDIPRRLPEPLGRARIVNPVSVVQMGLGAWQIAFADARWHEVVVRAADWVVEAMDGEGRLAYEFPMPHTYEIEPPWYSAMAQGQAASLLVRAARTLQRPALYDAAVHAVRSMVDPASPIVAETFEGPVLQEYPTEPPAHVLNGWIFALWGLHDLVAGWAQRFPQTPSDATPPPLVRDARKAFELGVEALAQRLPMYHAPAGWSRYDLYPHPLIHIASPFYHRLHISQLAAMYEIVPRDIFRETARRWETAATSRIALTHAVARKVCFRLVRPRRRAV